MRSFLLSQIDRLSIDGLITNNLLEVIWRSVLQNHSAGKEDYSEGGKYFERFYSLDLVWNLVGFCLDFVWNPLKDQSDHFCTISISTGNYLVICRLKDVQ